MALQIDAWDAREITLALLGMGKLDAQATAIAPSYNKSHYSECRSHASEFTTEYSLLQYKLVNEKRGNCYLIGLDYVTVGCGEKFLREI